MMDEDQAANRINITPLVDICLSLVLVFMVTMPLSTLYGITVKRDVLRQYGLATPQDHVVVHLTAGGVLIEDEKGRGQPVPFKDFGVVLRQMIQISVTKEVRLKVDREVPHGQTVWVLDLAKQNGADDIAIMEGRRT